MILFRKMLHDNKCINGLTDTPLKLSLEIDGVISYEFASCRSDGGVSAFNTNSSRRQVTMMWREGG